MQPINFTNQLAETTREVRASWQKPEFKTFLDVIFPFCLAEAERGNEYCTIKFQDIQDKFKELNASFIGTIVELKTETMTGVDYRLVRSFSDYMMYNGITIWIHANNDIQIRWDIHRKN